MMHRWSDVNFTCSALLLLIFNCVDALDVMFEFYWVE